MNYIDQLIKHRDEQSYYEELNYFYLSEYGYELDSVFGWKIDVFHSVKEPEVIGRLKLIDLLEFIRRDHLFYPDSISNIIQINNSVKGEPGYEEIKTSLPIVSYNANFHMYKNMENMISPTNIMFLDIDNFNSREELLEYKNNIIYKYKWIIACYQSISKKGLHIIIKTDEISSNEDFNNKYEYVNNNYFRGRLDKYAKSLTRGAVISYDTNIYINEHPELLNLNDRNISKITHRKCDNNIKEGTKGLAKENIIRSYYTFLDDKNDSNSEVKKAIYDLLQKNKLKFKIESESSFFKDPNEPLYNWAGWDLVEMNLFPFLKNGIPEGKRTFVIGRLSMELIYLNGMNKENKKNILSFLYGINKKLCSPPLKASEVRNSFNDNWRKYQNGELDFSSVIKKKRSLWSSECKLKRKEKISKSLVLYYKWKIRTKLTPQER